MAQCSGKVVRVPSAGGAEPGGPVGSPVPFLAQFLQHPGVLLLTSRRGGWHSAAPGAPSHWQISASEKASSIPSIQRCQEGEGDLQDNSDLSARTEYTEEDLSGSRRVRGKGSFYYKTNSIEMEILLCFFNQFNSIWQHKIIQYYSHDIHIFPFPFFASIPQAGWSW